MKKNKNSDLNNEKIEITYIENGEEVVRKISEDEFFNTNDFCLVGNQQVVRVSKDIELLHIKNLHFKSNMTFCCNNIETLLILDECYFNGDITFNNGNISIVNPRFINHIAYCGLKKVYEGANLYFNASSFVELNLGKRNLKDCVIHNCEIVNGNNLTIVGDASNIKIKDISTHSIWNKIENINLRGVENFTFNELDAKNITIEDSKNITFNRNINYDTLKISNSAVNISCEIMGQDAIYEDSITEIKNSTLTLTNSKVTISGDTYYQTNGNRKLVFLDDKFNSNGNKATKTADLISCLYGIRQIVEDERDKRIKKVRDEYIDAMENIERDIDEYIEQIAEYKKQISSYENLINDGKQRKDKLYRKNIGDCISIDSKINDEEIKSFVKKSSITRNK